jgi:hypothetical protein
MEMKMRTLIIPAYKSIENFPKLREALELTRSVLKRTPMNDHRRSYRIE